MVEAAAILNGDRRALAKGITLIESSRKSDRDAAQQLLQQLLTHTGNSIRLGISGSPGVGKSTFIETFGMHLIKAGRKVAVLAVDPSSPISGGSILGDKVRMERLARHSHAFIRPSPAANASGGVAQKTREALLLCEAAGFDLVIIETLGVGQNEYQVASMVDFFMALILPNSGDELQGIKKGMIELVDALVINKADGDSLKLAQQSQAYYSSAIRLLKRDSFWEPQVICCSAIENKNIDSIWTLIDNYYSKASDNNYLKSKREQQSCLWMQELVREMLEIKLNNEVGNKTLKKQLEQAVIDGSLTPYAAAQKLIEAL